MTKKPDFLKLLDERVLVLDGAMGTNLHRYDPSDADWGGKEFVKLPDERIGEMFVFRVFDRISYALIMNVGKPVKVGDRFTQPDDTQYASVEPRPAASALPAAAPVVPAPLQTPSNPPTKN